LRAVEEEVEPDFDGEVELEVEVEALPRLAGPPGRDEPV
jgi:hypothetical protein